MGTWFYVVARNAALALIEQDSLRQRLPIREEADIAATPGDWAPPPFEVTTTSSRCPSRGSLT